MYIVYGAGRLGEILGSCLQDEILFYIDNDPRKQRMGVHGHKVFSLYDSLNHVNHGEVVIAILDTQVSKEVKNQLYDVGCTHFRNATEIINACDSYNGEMFGYNYSFLLDELCGLGDLRQWVFHLQVWRDVFCKHYICSMRKIVDYINREKGNEHSRILDMGSGLGWWSFFYEENGWDVVGVDKDVARVEFVNNISRNSNRSVRCFCGNIVEWKQKGEYDVAVCNDTLHVISQWKEILNNMVENVKEGGNIILTMPNVQCQSIIDEYINNPVYSLQKDATRENILKYLKENGADLLYEFGMDPQGEEFRYYMFLFKRIEMNGNC